MAKKKDQDTEAVAEGTEGKKSKKGLFIIIIIVVLLLGGGGFGAYWFWLRTPPLTVEQQAEIEAAKTPEPVILPVFALKPFVVNLADKKRRYLKVTMKLELSNEELLEEIDKRRAQIRDVVLTLLSSKTASEIGTLEGKFLLRQDIIKRVNVSLVKGKVTKVYWEEFVVQ
ncbi:MAG: flagellar basal body-associated FliL family protein [Deltaproteobacteria bacterium]|nr:flagellar basal body-associated FliL family protein [Candidatus Tharpella sp.]